MLEGKQFRSFTDHKPLVLALFRTSPSWSAMQQRRLSFLSEFNCKIHHLPGPENVAADALSCPESDTVQQHLPSTTPTTKVSTLHPPPPPSRCIFLRDVPSSFNSPSPKVEFLRYASALSVVSVPSSSSNLLVTRPQVSSDPWFLRRWEGLFFEAIHKMSHSDKFASRRLVSRSFIWEVLSKDVNLWSQLSVLSQLPAEQGSNPYQVSSSTNSGSW